MAYISVNHLVFWVGVWVGGGVGVGVGDELLSAGRHHLGPEKNDLI